MANVLITGGTGLVGRRLGMMLNDRGYQVSLLSRKSQTGSPFSNYIWDPDQNQIDPEALQNCDYLLHLAGENIGSGRWTSKRKKAIMDSRVLSAETLFNNLEPDHKLKAFISASAIGYYGAVTGPEIHVESDPPGKDFLGHICENWESAADRFGKKGIRTVKIRMGVVLSAEGGALSRLTPFTKMGLGAPIGSGKQYMPWIHIDDLCEIFIKSIEDEEIKGAYNAVSPEQLTNREFTRQIARSLGKPFWLPNIPALVMKILYGRMSVMLLEGSRVSPGKIMEAGFSFQFPELEKALKQIFLTGGG